MAYQTQVFSGGGRVFVATKHIPTKLHTQVVINGNIIDISEYQIMNNSLVLNEETEEDVVLRISDNPNEFDDIVIQVVTEGTWGEIVGDVENQDDLTVFLSENYEAKTSIRNGINSNSPRDVVSISRDNATRTITIMPLSEDGYSFYSNNVEYTITETLTRQFPNVQGDYYVYFDGNGVLQVVNEFNDDLLIKYALVDIGYWSVSKQASLNNYEFHTSQINGLWHKQQHETVGAVYAYGFTEVAQDPPQAFDGSSNDDIRVQITSGKMWDEELPHILEPKTLNEDMTLLYRVGSDWEWVSQADSVYNILNVPQWDNGGVMTPHTDGYYGVAIFYKAPFTDDPETVCVMSQGEYATIDEASEACKIRPNISGMPIPEFRALFAKPYKYDSTYTNDSRCTFVPLNDGTDKILWYWKTGIENAGGGAGTLSSTDIPDIDTYTNITPTEETQKGFNNGVDNAIGLVADMSQYSITGTFSALNVNNFLAIVGLGSLPEIGDIVQVIGSVSNDGEYTVESIHNSDIIIVNQAHAGGTTSKSLVDESGTANVTIKILAKWYNASSGLGQGWVDMTSERLKNVTYLNSTNREITVSAYPSFGDATATAGYVDGVLAAYNYVAGNARPGVTFPVPPGSEYEVTTTETSLIYYGEKR